MYISNYYPSWLSWVLPRDSTLRFSLNGCSSKNLQQPQGSPWLWSWQQAGVQCTLCSVHCVKFSVQCAVSSDVQSSVCAVLGSVLCHLVCSKVWAEQCSLLCHLVCRLARCSQVQPGGGIGSRLARTDMTNGLRTSRRAIIPNATPPCTPEHQPGAQSNHLVHHLICTIAPLHNCTTVQLHNSQLHNCTCCNNIDLLSSAQFFENRDTLVSTTTAHPSVKCRMFQNTLKLGHRVCLI